AAAVGRRPGRTWTGGSSAAVAADATMIRAARERQWTHTESLQDATSTSELRAGDSVPLFLALASPAVRNVHAHHRARAEGSPP
ncbi:hypothetical protein, partial [Streptomyces sp. BF23-30]